MAKKKDFENSEELNSQGEKKEDSQKELEDILGKLKESDRISSAPRQKEPEPTPDVSGKESRTTEPEGIDQILQSIKEKPEEKPVEELNFLQRVIGVFTNPERVFHYLRAKPDYVLPILLAIILTVISSFFVYDIAINDQIAKLEKNDQIPDDRKELMLERMEASKQGVERIVYMFVLPPISILIIYALISAIFMFVGNIILGGKARFVQVLSTYSYSYLIVLFLGLIIKTPLILARQTVDVNLSPAVFFSPEHIGQAMFNFLQSFDILTIWFLIVFGIGFAIIYSFSKPKGMISVITVWLVYVLIFKVFLAMLFKGLTG